jgi:hypothetical protein
MINCAEPYLQATLLCEGVITDENGRHTIYNEFSQCTMGYSQPFTILTIWRGGDNDSNQNYKEQIEILAPDGRVIASGENGPFSLQNNTYRQINSILLEDIDFTNEGVYEIQIKLLNSHNSIIKYHCEPIMVI